MHQQYFALCGTPPADTSFLHIFLLKRYSSIALDPRVRGGDLQTHHCLWRDEEEEKPPVYAQGLEVGESEAGEDKSLVSKVDVDEEFTFRRMFKLLEGLLYSDSLLSAPRRSHSLTMIHWISWLW